MCRYMNMHATAAHIMSLPIWNIVSEYKREKKTSTSHEEKEQADEIEEDSERSRTVEWNNGLAVNDFLPFEYEM